MVAFYPLEYAVERVSGEAVERQGGAEDYADATVHAKMLLGADLAETVAAETGADVLVLDPVEGIIRTASATTTSR